jgi:hypothetical protein
MWLFGNIELLNTFYSAGFKSACMPIWRHELSRNHEKHGERLRDISFICKTGKTGEPLSAFFTHY